MPDQAAPVLAPPAALPSTPTRSRRAARALIQGLLGLTLGLGLVESTFRWRDGGAFPLVNVYEPESVLGVRLEPRTETLVGQRGGRVTRVRVNAQGYRGADWPAPSATEVAVIGDSLSFGLGVEEEEALAPRLREALGGGRSVIDASVPTYGPPEYLVTLKEVVAARKPAAVVLVINMLNDFGEIHRPNTERHAVLDGWAIRRGLVPVSPSSRARKLVIRHSHAAFALWRWQRGREARSAPVEPDHGARDLLTLAAARRSARAAEAAAEARVEPPLLGLALLAGSDPDARAPRTPIFEMVRKHHEAIAASGQGFWDAAWNAHLDDDYLDTRPTWLAWCGWGARDWAEVRRNRAAQDAHRKMIDALRRFAALPGTDPEVRREIEEAAERTARPPKKPEPREPPRMPPMPIESFVRDAVAASPGGALVVLTVPLQAQIEPRMRDRHGLGAADVAALDDLVRDLTAFATQVGARGVDPTEVLRRVGPAAYLPDGHLSAAGHDAIARAVAGALSPPR